MTWQQTAKAEGWHKKSECEITKTAPVYLEKIASLEAGTSELAQKCDWQGKQMDTFVAKLAEKSDRIAELAADIERREREWQSCRAKIAELEAQLKQETARADKLFDMLEKEKDINRIEIIKSKNFWKEANKGSIRIAELEAEVQGLNETHAKKNGMIARLEAQLAEYDICICGHSQMEHVLADMEVGQPAYCDECEEGSGCNADDRTGKFISAKQANYQQLLKTINENRISSSHGEAKPPPDTRLCDECQLRVGAKPPQSQKFKDILLMHMAIEPDGRWIKTLLKEYKATHQQAQPEEK